MLLADMHVICIHAQTKAWLVGNHQTTVQLHFDMPMLPSNRCKKCAQVQPSLSLLLDCVLI